MKKILTLSLALVLISAAVSAQRDPGDRIRKQRISNSFSNGQLTRSERFELRKDATRYKLAQRNARRDGVVSPFERRRLHKIRSNGRRDVFRFRHNGRNRVI
jgi:hypothetical protein